MGYQGDARDVWQFLLGPVTGAVVHHDQLLLRILQFQQRQPVLDARQVNEAAVPRVGAARAIEQSAQPPQAARIEAQDDGMPFRHQHALHFAQDLVRIGAEFEHVRQHQQIDAVAGKRQVGKFGAQINIAVRRDATVHGNTVGAQKIVFGQAELQRIEAEHIGDRVVDVFKLAREHVTAERRSEPLGRRDRCCKQA